jgi:hypothetical protein
LEQCRKKIMITHFMGANYQCDLAILGTVQKKKS